MDKIISLEVRVIETQPIVIDRVSLIQLTEENTQTETALKLVTGLDNIKYLSFPRKRPSKIKQHIVMIVLPFLSDLLFE